MKLRLSKILTKDFADFGRKYTKCIKLENSVRKSKFLNSYTNYFSAG